MAPLPFVSETHVVAFFLVLARLSPLFVLAPLFSSKTIPVRAKGVCAVALAVGLTPVALDAGASAIPLDDVLGLGGLVLKELLVGLGYAFALSALFAAVAAAGALVDTLIGFSFGALVDPVSGNQSSVLAQLYSMVAVMIFIAIGGDGWVIKGIARSYDLVPLADAPQLGPLVAGAQQAFASVFTSAVELCAPILLALVLTDAAFGIVSKVVPQVNVFAVGFPAKVLVGLLILGATLPFAATWLGDEAQRSIGEALRVLKAG